MRPDTADYSQGVINGLTDRKKERSVAGIKEAYAELDQKWLRLRVGKQIFDWSVTDTVSPADNLNPRDWTDVIRWERMGVPSVALRLGYDSYLELVYVPLFTPSRLSTAESRWERDMPQGLKYGEQEAVSRNHGQYGTRAGAVWNGFDLGVSYFHGYGYSPSVKIASVSATETVLAPVNYREVNCNDAFYLLKFFNVHGYLQKNNAAQFPDGTLEPYQFVPRDIGDKEEGD